ncbi:Uncharacterized protein Fot_21382 [Forsythia ovata]|uniref:Uncharacterized protein n=1 Tax=Forsythia ovata TaxID=205694 RepID=A0ABD1UUP3_9LAMI
MNSSSFFKPFSPASQPGRRLAAQRGAQPVLFIFICSIIEAAPAQSNSSSDSLKTEAHLSDSIEVIFMKLDQLVQVALVLLLMLSILRTLRNLNVVEVVGFQTPPQFEYYKELEDAKLGEKQKSQNPKIKKWCNEISPQD